MLDFSVKVIILAGGLGTRIAEETDTKPKPMVLVGNQPILWHVMHIFALQGYKDFIIATGYKHEIIDSWAKSIDSDWQISTFFTGSTTQTGGRIKRCIEEFPSDRYFITYGDGLANINLEALLKLHLDSNRTATVTAVRPPARFGVLEIHDGLVRHFGEKRQTDSGWINGGFLVVENNIRESIRGDSDALETGPLPALASKGQLNAYLHQGFWQPMDTLREKRILDELSSNARPPWLEL